MSKDIKKLVDNNVKWAKESEKIRKVQISLDFSEAADVLLRTLAAGQHQAPSALIRDILGMPSSPPKRARIGVSFNDEELRVLAKRYNVDPTNKAEIRRRMTDEVTNVMSSAELGLGDKKVGQDSDVNTDLKIASDVIYQRFKAAIANRN